MTRTAMIAKSGTEIIPSEECRLASCHVSTRTGSRRDVGGVAPVRLPLRSQSRL
jgi:hypothetical protein